MLRDAKSLGEADGNPYREHLFAHLPGPHPDYQRPAVDHPDPRAIHGITKRNMVVTADVQNRTVATFPPEKPFQQNTVYTVMLLGADASLTTEVPKNAAGEALALSYQWVFTTGC